MPQLPPNHTKPPRAWRRALLWCMAALLCLNTAVPLLAALAAEHHGLSVAEVCSVYGVRTAPAGEHDHHEHPAGGHHAPQGDSKGHCALGALTTGGMAAAATAVVLHAPLQPAPSQPAPWTALPPDASLRWLVARHHAPPPAA